MISHQLITLPEDILLSRPSFQFTGARMTSSPSWYSVYVLCVVLPTIHRCQNDQLTQLVQCLCALCCSPYNSQVPEWPAHPVGTVSMCSVLFSLQFTGAWMTSSPSWYSVYVLCVVLPTIHTGLNLISLRLVTGMVLGPSENIWITRLWTI